jgi:integrase
MLEKGRRCTVQPIKRKKDIQAIKKLLHDNKRNLAIFTLGINSALRASDLLQIRFHEVKDLLPGQSFQIWEKKTGKKRQVTLNKNSHQALKSYLKVRMPTPDNEDVPLFLSQKGPYRGLNVASLHRKIKSWCQMINLNGNFGSHSLRKTFGYQQRVAHKVGISSLMICFNHSNQSQTLRYLGIDDQEIHNVFMNDI